MRVGMYIYTDRAPALSLTHPRVASAKDRGGKAEKNEKINYLSCVALLVGSGGGHAWMKNATGCLLKVIN